MSASQGDMDVQPVDIHNKICRFSLLPYPYKATILCFSNFVLFQQLLHVSVLYELRHLFWALACWLAQYRYHIGLFTDHTQFMSSWCISLAFIKSNLQFYLTLSELLTLHPLQILLQFLLWCGADGCKSNILFSYVLMICRFVSTQQMWKRVGWGSRKITQQSMQEQDLEQGP